MLHLLSVDVDYKKKKGIWENSYAEVTYVAAAVKKCCNKCGNFIKVVQRKNVKPSRWNDG
jgi:hypothetical protein